MFPVSKTVEVFGDKCVLFTPDEIKANAQLLSPHKLSDADLTRVVIESVEVSGTNDRNVPIAVNMGKDIDRLSCTTLGQKNEPTLAVFKPMSAIVEPSTDFLKFIPAADELAQKVQKAIKTVRQPPLTDDSDNSPVFLVDKTNTAYLALDRPFVENVVVDSPQRHKVQPGVATIADEEELQKVLEKHVLDHAVVDCSTSGLVVTLSPLVEREEDEKFMVCLTVKMVMGLVDKPGNVIRD